MFETGSSVHLIITVMVELLAFFSHHLWIRNKDFLCVWSSFFPWGFDENEIMQTYSKMRCGGLIEESGGELKKEKLQLQMMLLLLAK